MPRGGPRGNKKSHKGQRRHFTSEYELKAQVEKQEKEKEWRRKKGIESDDETEEGAAEDGAAATDKKKDDTEGVQFGGESSESESDSEDESKAKGVQHLIAVDNPNHIQKKTKKVESLSIEGDDSKPVLSRREKEEIEKQQARAHYQKLHLAGKTEEARADMARLALIKKNREEAARKREEEKRAADEKKKIAEQRLLDRKAQQQLKK